jgi:RimJ/RimL family protein N-acetyltransferase
MAREHWPLFDLRVTSPRVELRYPTDDDLFALAAILQDGIHDPSTMPFLRPWTRAESPTLERDALRHWWSLRTELRAEQWHLGFAVYVDGEPVGVQGVGAQDYAITRSVTTGSWLVRRAQGRGIGKEMRTAVLHLAFAGLDAAEAHTAAFEDNPASLGVTRALGYEPNGTYVFAREGKRVRQFSFVMTRERWQATRRSDFDIAGLEPCLPFVVGEPAPATGSRGG